MRFGVLCRWVDQAWQWWTGAGFSLVRRASPSLWQSPRHAKPSAGKEVYLAPRLTAWHCGAASNFLFLYSAPLRPWEHLHLFILCAFFVDKRYTYC